MNQDLWQPVSDIPKDGSTVLGLFPFRTCKVVPILWSGWGGGVWENASSGGRLVDEPVAFMSLTDLVPSQRRINELVDLKNRDTF